VGAVFIVISGYSVAVTLAVASFIFLFFFPNDEFSLIIKSCFEVDYCEGTRACSYIIGWYS
jgi:hypothetical protein